MTAPEWFDGTPDPDGLHAKYTVTRNDGEEKPGARYFVLDYVNDPIAREALRFYANLVWRSNPTLADDLSEALRQSEGRA